jgi:hypothetical protein
MYGHYVNTVQPKDCFKDQHSEKRHKPLEKNKYTDRFYSKPHHSTPNTMWDVVLHVHVLICKQIVYDVYKRLLERHPRMMDISIIYRAHDIPKTSFFESKNNIEKKNQRQFIRKKLNISNMLDFREGILTNMIFLTTCSNESVIHNNENMLMEDILYEQRKHETSNQIEIIVGVHSKIIRLFINKFYHQQIDKKTLHQMLYRFGANHNIQWINMRNLDTPMVYWGCDDYALKIEYHRERLNKNTVFVDHDIIHAKKHKQQQNYRLETPEPSSSSWMFEEYAIKQEDHSDQDDDDDDDGESCEDMDEYNPCKNENNDRFFQKETSNMSKITIKNEDMLLDILKRWTLSLHLESKNEQEYYKNICKDHVYPPTQLRKKLHDDNYAFSKKDLDQFLKNLVRKGYLFFDPIIQKNQNVYFLSYHAF